MKYIYTLYIQRSSNHDSGFIDEHYSCIGKYKLLLPVTGSNRVQYFSLLFKIISCLIKVPEIIYCCGQ